MSRVSLFIITGVTLVALALRLVGLGSFMTADESQWMIRSGEYWHALLALNPGGTFLTTHPGATAMWLIGAGVVIQEHRLGFHIDTSNLQHFRVAATLPVAVATSLLIGVATWLVYRLLGWRVAMVSGVLLAVDPYLVGLSQIAHLDALLALCMLTASLALLVWVQQYQRRYLLLAAVLTGLAVATKMLPALWLFIFFAMVSVVIVHRQRWIPSAWLKILRSGVLFVLISALIVFITWPALWVKRDVGHSFTRDVATVIEDDHVAIDDGTDIGSAVSFYIRTMLARSTPWVVIIIGAVIVAGVAAVWSQRYQRLPTEIVVLLISAVGFLLLITYVAKKSDRYALPALSILPLVAGWAVVGGWQAIIARWPALARRQIIIGPAFMALLVLPTALLSPYAIAYTNPLLPPLQPLHQQGWGEGLDAAAAWLNGHPLIDRLTVASWYPSVLAPYFHGTTMSLSSRDDHRVGYVVLYRNMGDRGDDSVATDILRDYEDNTPVHVVSIQGRPYVEIYEQLGSHYFPHHTGELYGVTEVGQTVQPQQPWDSIEIGFATFSGRSNTHDVVLHIRDGIDATQDLRTVTINAAQINDATWYRFTFEPLPAGQYYVVLTSPTSISGNAVAVRFIDRNFLPGDMLLRRREMKAGETAHNFVRSDRDVAYRIP